MARFNLNDATEDEVLRYFRTATRLDRATLLVDWVVEESNGIYLVRSQRNPEKQYIVDLHARTCECADWTFRGCITGIACKHLMAAYLAVHRKASPDWEVTQE